MFTGLIDTISNKATWASKTYELVDEDDGTTTDLTDSNLTVDVVVTIRDISSPSDSNGTTTPTALATASIDNGKVTIPGPGFQWQFEVDDLTSLCAGTYCVGAKVTIDDFVTDLIIGTLAVTEGN